MTPSVVVIQQPSIDFTTFIGLSHKVLGYSPASAVDQSRLNHSDSERFVSCLAALRDQSASAGITPNTNANLLTFVSFGLFVVADERDMLDIMECCAGMPVALADTLARGVMAAVIVGHLSQWRDAVKTGCSTVMEHNVRGCFNIIHALFSDLGLNVWKDLNSRSMPDQTFFLEDKRGR